MADPMYEQLMAKRASAATEPDMGMMPPPAADAAMGMDMGMEMPMDPEMPMTEDDAEMIAEEGRGGDVVMGHLTPGEIVIPVDLAEDPDFMRVLQDAFDSYEMDMERYTVGSEANSINPDTGYPEFYIDYNAQFQIEAARHQHQTIERMANEQTQWALAAERREQNRLNREATLKASREASARARRQSQQAAARAARQRQFAAAERVKKEQFAAAQAKERRGFEKLQVAKQERRAEAKQRGKTLAAGAAAESVTQTQAKKPVAKRAARRTAPVRAYSTPGSGGGVHTAAGKRPV